MPIPPLKIVISGVDRFSSQLNRSMRNIRRFSRGVENAGRAMTLGLTLPMVAFGAASVRSSMQFNESMANVATLIPGNIKRVQSLKRGVLDLSVATGKSANDISAGLFQVISAFGDTSETMEKLTINTRAAVAGVSTVSDAINLTSAVTKAFGDTSAKTTQKVVDLAFKANELGQTTFAELAQALPRVTALSQSLGVSMEEMFAVMATGTGVTGNTAEVSTQLASVLGALTKPTTDMEKALEALGFRGRNAAKELIASQGLFGALQKLESITSKYNVPLAKVLGQKEGLILTTSLLGAQTDKYRMSLDQMSNSMGAADKAFKEQTEGINEAGFQWNQFIARLNRGMILIGDKLAPTLIKLTKVVEPLVRGFLQLSDRTKGVIIGLAGIVAVIGPLLILSAKLISSVSLLVTTFNLIKGAAFIPKLFGGIAIAIKAVGSSLMFLVTNPIGLAITGIAAIALGAYLIIKHWDKVSAWFHEFFGWLTDMVDIVSSKISGLLPDWLKDKIGLIFGGGFGGSETSATDLRSAAVQNVNRNENRTEIEIRNRTDAEVRTETAKGEVDIMTDMGWAFQE